MSFFLNFLAKNDFSKHCYGSRPWRFTKKKEKYCFASSFVVFWGRAGAVRPLIERTQTSSSVTSQICFCLKATFLGRPNSSPSKQWWCTKRCLTSVLLLLQRLLLLYSRAVQHTQVKSSYWRFNYYKINKIDLEPKVCSMWQTLNLGAKIQTNFS